jgi:aspartate/methionine/tyrosine aminotransferase
MLLETKVGMAPGIAFGAPGEGYMRMCFAASETVLAPALEKFGEYLENQLLD